MTPPGETSPSSALARACYASLYRSQLRSSETAAGTSIREKKSEEFAHRFESLHDRRHYRRRVGDRRPCVLGLVSAQKGATPTVTAASTVRVASVTQNVPALPAACAGSVKLLKRRGSEAANRRHNAVKRPAALPAAAPTRLAQTTPAPASSAASAPAPNASGRNNPASNIPACDKPGGMGLSRIVEIDATGGPGFGSSTSSSTTSCATRRSS